jgi:hypothetical protein
MNRFLFYSSLVYGILLCLLLSVYGGRVGILEAVIVAGIFTSIWNHGTTNRVALVCDRAVMVLGFLLIAFLCVQNRYTLLLLLLLLSASFYCVAKTFGNDIWHLTGQTILVGLLVILVPLSIKLH